MSAVVRRFATALYLAVAFGFAALVGLRIELGMWAEATPFGILALISTGLFLCHANSED